MKKQLATVFASFLFVSAVQADDDYKHFPSLDAPNTQIALCNLATFNEKLAAIANKKELTPEDMVKVHELTYTLENAVMRLQKDLDTIAVDLEKVHKASERLDDQTIKNDGGKYLKATGLLLDPATCK